MMESSRLLIAWPTCFQDVGALLFIALALHEAVAARLPTFLAAGLAALLCKEVAVVPLATAALCPAVRFDDERRRRAWIASTGLLVLAWVLVYAWVHAHAALIIPGTGLTRETSLDWLRALALVPWWSFKAIWSLAPAPGPADLLLVVGLVGLILWPRAASAFRSPAAELRAWWTWGLLWSVPLLLTLLPFYPGWAPYRFALVGFGLLAAAVATLQIVHPRAVPLFLLLRLALLAIAPTPVRGIAIEPPDRGAAIDVPRLSRLQRFVREVRFRLRARHPSLPPGTAVVWENFPAMTEYAFGMQPALHVWYRDTTLHWLPIRRWMEDAAVPTATIVEFQPGDEPALALIDPDAMRALLRANEALNSGRESETLTWLARAKSLQHDTTARVFLHSLAGKRAYAIASLRLGEGRFDEARAALREVLGLFPGDEPSRRLLARIDTLAARPSPPALPAFR
jgi:hypothetical protein